MSLINIAFLKDDFQKVSKLLLSSGIAEVTSARRFIMDRERIQTMDSSQLVVRTRTLLARVDELLKVMNVPREKFSCDDLQLDVKVVDEIEEKFNQLQSQANALLKREEECNTRIEQLDYKSRFLSSLEDMDILPGELSGLPHIYFKTGVIEAGNFRKLVEILKQSDIPFIFTIGGYVKEEMLLFIASLIENSHHMDSALRALNFKEITVFEEDKDRNLSQLLEDIELELWSLRESLAEVHREYQKFRHQTGKELNRIYWILENNLKIYQAMQDFLQSHYNYFLSLWIPSNMVTEFKSKLSELVGNRYEFREYRAEILLGSKKVKYEEVPSAINHSVFFRPFQRMLSLYGWPAYLHVDPTIFMGISFVLMFGMMFADLGHGFVLAVAGLLTLIQKKIPFLKEIAGVLLYCGISSCAFGVLFGSVFGRENIISPLWFNPGQEPMKFLELGISLGIVLISLGIILNIVQFIWQRRFRKVLFSQWGFFSLIFYWLALFIFIAGLKYNVVEFSLTTLIIILGIPLLIVIIGDLIFAKSEGRDSSEVIVMSMEIIMGLLTNTISYVRVAAFGLTHMALMTSVYLIAETMSGMRILKESSIIEGNIGVILLEGLIVFIQCLRLEYYEFFSKFFSLPGRRFNPLKVEG